VRYKCSGGIKKRQEPLRGGLAKKAGELARLEPDSPGQEGGNCRDSGLRDHGLAPTFGAIRLSISTGVPSTTRLSYLIVLLEKTNCGNGSFFWVNHLGWVVVRVPSVKR
jgi:hypothetical protein